MSEREKNNPDQETCLIGRNPVLEALQRDEIRITKVYLQTGISGSFGSQIRKLALSRHIPVQFVPSVKLNRFAGGLNHQGVVAFSTPVSYFDLDEMLTRIAPTKDQVRGQKPTLLLLDRIQDPYNFGAILRSAVAAGAAGVIVPKQDMAPLNAAALKASAGTAARIPIARVTKIQDVVYQLKERGYWIAGASEAGRTSIWDMDWDRPVVLIVGNEGQGISQSLTESCDFLVSIPMVGPIESLNVSVAAGIFLFVANRQKTSIVHPRVGVPSR